MEIFPSDPVASLGQLMWTFREVEIIAARIGSYQREIHWSKVGFLHFSSCSRPEQSLLHIMKSVST